MNDPSKLKTYEVQLSSDATFNDIIAIINTLHIRYTCEPNDPQHITLEKHSREV